MLKPFIKNGNKFSAVGSSVVEIINIIHPVGSIYISTDETNPATVFGVGVWERIGAGRCLMGATEDYAPGNTAEAGLPNITGYFTAYSWSTGFGGGAFSTNIANTKQIAGTSNDKNYIEVNFDASKSSDVYGKSSTVQPPAYFVCIWKRVS